MTSPTMSWARYIVRDLRLLMAGHVRILRKEIITRAAQALAAGPALIDLSHTIYDGLVTYKGLPAPIICDYLSREELARSAMRPARSSRSARSRWSPTPAPTSTAPSIATRMARTSPRSICPRFADLDGVLVRADYRKDLAVTPAAFEGLDVAGKAVLVHTGWAEHWATDAYFETHPFLTEDAAIYLRDRGARLVGIDSLNIDDTRGGARPVHSTLLRAEILIVEHLCNLESVPERGLHLQRHPAQIPGRRHVPCPRLRPPHLAASSASPGRPCVPYLPLRVLVLEVFAPHPRRARV